jgi:hypothetical protein
MHQAFAALPKLNPTQLKPLNRRFGSSMQVALYNEGGPPSSTRAGHWMAGSLLNSVGAVLGMQGGAHVLQACAENRMQAGSHCKPWECRGAHHGLPAHPRPGGLRSSGLHWTTVNRHALQCTAELLIGATTLPEPQPQGPAGSHTPVPMIWSAGTLRRCVAAARVRKVLNSASVSSFVDRWQQLCRCWAACCNGLVQDGSRLEGTCVCSVHCRAPLGGPASTASVSGFMHPLRKHGHPLEPCIAGPPLRSRARTR